MSCYGLECVDCREGLPVLATSVGDLLAPCVPTCHCCGRQLPDSMLFDTTLGFHRRHWGHTLTTFEVDDNGARVRSANRNLKPSSNDEKSGSN